MTFSPFLTNFIHFHIISYLEIKEQKDGFWNPFPYEERLAAHDAYSGPTVHPVRSGSTPAHRSVKTASPVCLSLFISHPFAVSIHLLNLCCVCLSFCKPHYRSSPCSNGCGDLREGSRRRPQQARRLYVVSRASSFLIQLRFSVR